MAIALWLKCYQSGKVSWTEPEDEVYDASQSRSGNNKYLHRKLEPGMGGALNIVPASMCMSRLENTKAASQPKLWAASNTEPVNGKSRTANTHLHTIPTIVLSSASDV